MLFTVRFLTYMHHKSPQPPFAKGGRFVTNPFVTSLFKVPLCEGGFSGISLTQALSQQYYD